MLSGKGKGGFRELGREGIGRRGRKRDGYGEGGAPQNKNLTLHHGA